MNKLSKLQFEKRLAAIESEVYLFEAEDSPDTFCWLDENDNPIPFGVHFRGMSPKAAQKALNEAVARYIDGYRCIEDLMVQAKALAKQEQSEKMLSDSRTRCEVEGFGLSERELKLLASKEMNKYGSYEAYQNRPKKPLSEDLRKRLDEVYGDTQT
jgi:hypothetical protein